MGLLDLFRPKWKHSDAAVRAKALRGLSDDQRDIVVDAARRDADDGVRKVAIELLDDPTVLASIARDDDSKIGALAADRANTLWIERASAATDVETANEHLEHLEHVRAFTTVVQRARKASVRKAALKRVTDPKALGELARTAADAEVRRMVVDAIDDTDALCALAIGGEPKDVALAAIDRLDNVDALDRVIKKVRRKNLRNRAKKRLAEVAPPDKPEPTGPTPEQLHYAVQARLLAKVESAMVAKAYDREDEVEAAAQEWANLDSTDPALQERFDHATTQFAEGRAAHDEAVAAAKREAARAAERERIAAAKREQKAARQREKDEAKASTPAAWSEAQAEPEPEALAEPAPAPEPKPAMTAEEREQAARDNAAKLEAACVELEAAADATRVRDAQAAMTRAADVFAVPLRLPSKDMRAELETRYEAARTKVAGVIASLVENEKWRDWANLSKQRTLAERAQAVLATVDEQSELAKTLREFKDEWKMVSRVGAGKGEALWEKFRTACDGIEGKLREGYAVNLAAREELCERAEAWRDSTDWRGTAAAMRDLQAVWKTIGPVARADDQRTWSRFRSACDEFFEKRDAAMAVVKEQETKNAERKETLIAKLEALLPGITDERTHERATEEAKRLKKAWRDIGPAPRAVFETLDKRFRSAGDAVFGRLDELRREQKQVEAAAREEQRKEVASALAEPDVGADTLVELWSRVHDLGDPELRDACYQACERALTAQIAAFAGTELAPVNARRRKKKLCERVEALMSTPEESASVGEQLEQALASNAIGRTASTAEANAKRVAEARAAWSRIGPTPGEEGADLDARFEAAIVAATR